MDLAGTYNMNFSVDDVELCFVFHQALLFVQIHSCGGGIFLVF